MQQQQQQQQPQPQPQLMQPQQQPQPQPMQQSLQQQQPHAQQQHQQVQPSSIPQTVGQTQPIHHMTKTPSTGISPTNDNMVVSSQNMTPVTQPMLINTSRSSMVNKRYSTGHAVLRLLQFAEQLSPGDQALNRAFWDGFIGDFFTISSQTKLGLRNSETDEQKPYYMSHYSMATFFYTLYECGVSSIQLTLEQTMEYILPGGQMNVECPRANFIYRYNNGSLVASTGHLWVRFSLTQEGIWKIKHFEFACQANEEFIARSHLVLNKDGSKLKKSGKQALPESPINAWGLPSKAYHIMQMLDVAVQLDDIVFYSLMTGTTSKDSLNALAYNYELQMNTKDSIMSNSTAPLTPTTNTTSIPIDMDAMKSPSSKKKMTKRPSMSRRKSLKNEKSIKDESLEEDDLGKMNSGVQNGNQAVYGGMNNGPDSPVVKTQSGPRQAPQAYPLQQQQQQQQAFFQHQRKLILQQQAFQQQQAMFQMQHPSAALGPLPMTQSSDLLTQMSYPPHQAYPGSFGSQQTTQQLQEMDDYLQSPKQSKKRSNSISEAKESPISRKKGLSTPTPTSK
ncbi:LIM-domain binding protein-domain-containing protein [Halteromyces radiatus]|uniref:LIM-domain binding protein-domain-containing protein n=1 Tax=Halteromyces radiatus TaxID=101107 RepID=UPI00221E4DB2|nr:LIM-domain binding protein-domain-containing protein [Halteromyces radiatus]KAI8096590.1 LIM-domain binding protein-domain-containing protein [Halteromyces radiatus]